MRAFKSGVVELLLLCVISLVVGFGVNASRARGVIKLSKNYFTITTSQTPPDDRSTAAAVPSASVDSGARTGPADSGSGGVAAVESVGPGGHAEKSPYPILSADQVINFFNDPATESGLNVFIDARKDAAFEDGHIPGAVQFYPYEAERFLENVLARTNGVRRVIVYCNGGDCTDSKYACRDLLEAGLPEDAVFLFAEGWEAWIAKGMPVATGKEE